MFPQASKMMRRCTLGARLLSKMMRPCTLGALLLLSLCCRAGGYSYYNSLSVCSDSSIDVTGVSLLCDTPGVWYYGSNGYRKSTSCQKGDKASLVVTFDIVEDLSEVPSIYLSLFVYGGDEQVIVYRNAPLCYIGTLSKSSGVTCPNEGSFTISTKFYFGASDTTTDDNSSNNDRYLGDDDDSTKADDSSSHLSFTPVVTVGFASDKVSGDYDLGGANTNLCSGKTSNIDSGIASQLKSGISEPIVSFLLSFGLLFGTIFILGGLAFYIYNSRSCDGTLFPGTCDYEDPVVEDHDRKLALMRTTGILAL